MSVDCREDPSSEESFHSAGEFVDAPDFVAVHDAFSSLPESGSLPELPDSIRRSGTESERSRHRSRDVWRRVKGPRAKRLAKVGLLPRKYWNQHRGRQTISKEGRSGRDQSANTASEPIPREEDQDLRDGFNTPSPHASSYADSSSVSLGEEQSRHGQRLFDAAKNHLFYTIERRRETPKPKLPVLKLSTLQRIILHCIQTDLAKSVSAAYREGTLKDMNSNEVKDTLHAYCTATPL
ncbi:hypothetical protein NU219Hw_g2592t1 [Hortaea werneckii]